MQAPRKLAQLLERPVELLGSTCQERLERLGARFEPGAREPQGERERDEALLGAVVQVPLELAALLVACLDDARARCLQVLTRLCARHSERSQLAERHQPRLAVRRQLLAGGDRDRAPRDAADEDRRRDRRAVTNSEHRPRHVRVDRRVVLDACRQPGIAGAANRCVLVGEDAVADAEDAGAIAIVAPHDRGRVVGAHDPLQLGKDARRLLGHGGEDALRCRLRCNERRDAAERALLLSQPAHLGELRLDVSAERAVRRRGRVREVDPRRDQVRGVTVAGGHQLVRPGDQTAPAVLGRPVANLRAREPRSPDVREHVVEGLRLLGRDHAFARVAADHLLAPVASRALARVVEQQYPSIAVEHADESLRRLGQDPREVVAEAEVAAHVKGRRASPALHRRQ